MEYLPLDGGGASTVRELEQRRLLTPEQAQAVDTAALDRFLRSPLAEDLRRAERVEREFRFSLLVDAADYYPALRAGEDQVLLQGVVDLFAITDGKITVVDFKTDHIFTPPEIAERSEVYRPQLEAYSLALSRCLGRPVTCRRLYFLTPGASVEV